MNAFDATVTAYAEVGRDLWTDVKDCASLGLAFVSPCSCEIFQKPTAGPVKIQDIF